MHLHAVFANTGHDAHVRDGPADPGVFGWLSRHWIAGDWGMYPVACLFWILVVLAGLAITRRVMKRRARPK